MNNEKLIKEVSKIPQLESQMDSIEKQTQLNFREFMKPIFIEGMGSFSKMGFGVPSGIGNYTGGCVTAIVSGTKGSNTLTVTSNNASDLGGLWSCVIQKSDKIYELNKVLSSSGNTINLLKPLESDITNGVLANIHDSNLGQHYTAHGYYAFAQHILNQNPKFCERDKVIAQFLGTDTSGLITNIPSNQLTYNYSINPDTASTQGYFTTTSDKVTKAYISDGTKYIEYKTNISSKNGYIEAFIGGAIPYIVDISLDGVIIKTISSNGMVERVLCEFSNANEISIKIRPNGGVFAKDLYIGNITVFETNKFFNSQLINDGDKIVYIGDSWGTYFNQATTREMKRLLPNSEILNYSRAGHTSEYAKAWFQQYVVDNNPKYAIIEYFVNDFNSIGGINVGSFTNPSGQQQDMNISDVGEYVSNISYMINKCIENGIQPIVLMPFATNSFSQVKSFMTLSKGIWLGTKAISDTISLKSLTSTDIKTDKIKTKIIETLNSDVGSNLLINLLEQTNSGFQGVVVDTLNKITAGYLLQLKNQGTLSFGVSFLGDTSVNRLILKPQSNSIPDLEGFRGVFYIENNLSTGNVDVLKVKLKQADGSFISKTVQFV